MLPDPQVAWSKLPCLSRGYKGLNDPAANASGQGATSNLIVTSKYTWYDFLLLCLLQQYRKLSVIYFTVGMAINLIPAVSPFLPVTSIIPLVFVLAASMIKEAVEDAARHREDRATNNRLYQVLQRDGSSVQVKSQELKPGQVLRVVNGQPIPADLVLLKASGDAYLMTANLDGETNLKPRSPCQFTMGSSVEEIAKMRDTIEVQVPPVVSRDLYALAARLVLRSGQTFSVGDAQFVQRGAMLVNTDWILGVVVYVGKDTRLALNQKAPPTKYSVLERQLNWFVLAIFLLLQFICVMMAVGAVVWQNIKYDDGYGVILGKRENLGFLFWLERYATYFVLLSVFVPISLWVTMEIVRFVQALFMRWDTEMFAAVDPSEEKKRLRKKQQQTKVDDSDDEDDETRLRGMVAKTSNLNEDLGRIEHIFSDKTGTLTQNKMTYRCSCMGRGELFPANVNLGAKLREEGNAQALGTTVVHFMHVLALCHGIVPSVDEDGELVYRTPSPDEVALAKYAANCGFRFTKKVGDIYTVEELGVERQYKLLALCDFTSARRRMTVLVRDLQTGQAQALVKGADSMIYSLLRPADNDPTREAISERLKEFAREGLRTLVLAKRDLTKEEEEAFMAKYDEASKELEDRQAKLDAVYEDIESNLELVGATAVEDNLQDEVPETIEYLLRCGIQVWVLTGDKKETAENIGYSTRLLQPDMEIMEIALQKPELTQEACTKLVNELHERLPLGEDVSDSSVLNRALIVEGPCLEYLLSPQLADRFIELTRHMKSVVCCRTIPSNKALVVKAVRTKEKKVCLSVGDGANDVAMIQEAHVGVGIFGKEGTQAARASDYALHEFKHLRRLIAVHGRYSYLRNSGLILYSFYKNITFTAPLVYFSFFSGFSGQTVYDQWIISFFNIAFASLPPLIYGFFEKDIPESLIMRHPEVYKYYQRGVLFTWKRLFFWLGTAIVHSNVVFWSVWAMFWHLGDLDGTGRDGGLWAMGLIMSTVGVVIVNLRMAIEARYWTIITHIAIWGTILFYFLFMFVYAALYNYKLGFYGIYHVPYELARMPVFWLLLIFLPILALLPDFVFKYIQWTYFPQDWQILHERDVFGITRDADLVKSVKVRQFQERTNKEKNRTDPGRELEEIRPSQSPTAL